MGATTSLHVVTSEDHFRAFYQATYAALLRFVARRLPADRAEDVVAEAFLTVWRRIDELPDNLGDARAWTFGIARHVMLNDRRAQMRRESLAVRIVEHLPTGGTSEQGIDTDLVARRLDLATVWPRLSARDQEAIALTAWDGLTGEEAAAVLGISPVAYRIRLSRARQNLRRHLDLVSTNPSRTSPTSATTAATSPSSHTSQTASRKER
jgi:RNA polymerase sigma-70 factor (ECF subfamily)